MVYAVYMMHLILGGHCRNFVYTAIMKVVGAAPETHRNITS
jgi:hypothetical protein